jgi:hypothetical protein
LLARYGLAIGWSRFPGLTFDPMATEPCIDYYSYSVLWDNPRDGSAVLGNFMIDRRTGEVWSAVFCEQEHAPALAALQARMRARIGLDDAVYRRARRDGPYCG